MLERRGVSRRTFISDMGRGVLAISVGALALPACGSDDSASTGATTVAPSDTAADTTLATAAPTAGTGTPDSTAAPTTAPPPASAGLDVRRVDLGFVSAFVLVRGTEAAVVDTGVGGSAGAIEQALAEVGLGWGDVGNVVLTHRHPDHIGSLGDVADAATAAILGAGVEDVEAMSPPRPIDGYGDGDDVFGLQVIATPGHTPGHISVFDSASKILIAGDAINGDGSGVDDLVDGVGGPNPQFTPDMDTAVASVMKMAALEPETIYFGHGLPKIGGAAAAITALLESL